MNDLESPKSAATENVLSAQQEAINVLMGEAVTKEQIEAQLFVLKRIIDENIQEHNMVKWVSIYLCQLKRSLQTLSNKTIYKVYK